MSTDINPALEPTVYAPETSTICNALPGFFRGCIQRARRGGRHGYDHAAYELSRHVEDIVLGDLDDDIMDALMKLRVANDATGIVAWYDAHLPRCMALVPSERRESFTRGVERALDDLLL